MKEEALLKEYEICQNGSSHIDTTIWQTASIFIVLSVGGISLLAQGDEHSWSRFSIVALTGLFAIALTILWFLAVRRWWSFQRVIHYRMLEIERELGLCRLRYILYLHYLKKGRVEELYPNLSPKSDEEEQRYQKLRNTESKHFSMIPVHRVVKFITALIIVAWCILILREFLLTLLTN